jgi:hypothetical protein
MTAPPAPATGASAADDGPAGPPGPDTIHPSHHRRSRFQPLEVGRRPRPGARSRR